MYPVSISQNDPWLRQISASQSAGNGGVVRRNIADVERKVGRRVLELEVRRRGFHMSECGGQFVIVCSREEIHIFC